jgi:hypothetical protein
MGWGRMEPRSPTARSHTPEKPLRASNAYLSERLWRSVNLLICPSLAREQKRGAEGYACCNMCRKEISGCFGNPRKSLGLCGSVLQHKSRPGSPETASYHTDISRFFFVG